MTDMTKPTQKAECTANEAKREMGEASCGVQILTEVKTANDAVKYIAERFNGMRCELSSLCSLLKTTSTRSADFAEKFAAVSHGDYGKLLDGKVELPKNFDVEDAGLFAAQIADIVAMRKLENRMRACVLINAKIAEAIEGWKSKIEKMKARNGGDGSSQAELKVIEKKIVQFNEAIKILKKRGGQVSDIFLDAKKELMSFVVEQSEAFQVIYFNEGV